MKKRLIATCLLSTMLFMVGTPIKAYSEIEQYEPINFEVTNSRLRASYIVLNTGWSFNKDRCAFSLDFLRESTGSGTIVLQKKINNSWVDYKNTAIEFIKSYSMSSNITVSNLSAGDYRLKFIIQANGYSETLYSWEKTL